MNPLKIVIISRNSYPTLSPRSHRTTELAKEFASRGHQVIIYTLLGDYDYTKYSKETGITFKNLGKSKLGALDNVGYKNNQFWAKIGRKLFSKSFEVPNIELLPMVRKALKHEKNIDLLITIAHPHTIHWGAAKYIKNNRNKIGTWIADCGDPYMKNPFKKHPFYFKYFEKEWCRLCDSITVPIHKAKDAYYPEFKEKIKVIPQGFNFNNLKLAHYQPNSVPTFAFAGQAYKGLRDPNQFLKYISSLSFEFKFIVYTKSVKIFDDYKEKLKDRLEIRDFIPRENLLFELSKMDFLINIENKSGVQQPSKLIDYALTKRPILNITSDFKERKAFNAFISKDYSKQAEITNIDDYNIKIVASQFLELYK